MAGGDSVMWLRVEDEDIDAAELLRVTVNKSTTGSGRKRGTSSVCTGTPTCNAKQKMNNCVALLSFKPHEVNRFIQKRGKREARVVSGVRSHCIVVYGIFDPAIKPSAQQYNMQRLDCEMFLKFG